MRRRDFLTRLAAGGVSVFAARELAAQEAAPPQGVNSNLFDMDQEAARRVVRPPKRDARPSMTDDQRDALEHQIRCQCGCTLDVYTCRTTDFSCQVSPAMHRDVMALVQGGYSASEIIDAFVGTYGERVLMAPKKEGFNWAGYIVPFAALGAGAAAVAVVLRGMQRRTLQVAATRGPAPVAKSDGTADELARLQAAIRRDD
ncbi:MAG TPA: cytochrome c-type biogenesis protein CcmH [Gemmatimonadaceae bacterium]|nr:cytochrome c-type biogenesis protein CcmH [Gemmatimonadaceae bacterium]